MVMESRKAAPALRARLLRSYVPLRRDPSGSVLTGTIPGLPGGHFSTHTQNNPIINNIICIVNIKELSRYWSRIASNPAIITPGKFTSAHIQSAVSPTIPNFRKQEKTGAVPTAADRI